MSSLLNEINKDKEEILGIDELIRNEKWEEAKKLVEDNHKINIIEEKEEEHHVVDSHHSKRPKNGAAKLLKYSKDQLNFGGWEKEEGWERV